MSQPILDGVALKFAPLALLSHVVQKYSKTRRKDAKQQNECFKLFSKKTIFGCNPFVITNISISSCNCLFF